MPSLRVMVVEDTDHVRRMLVDMLELDGFEVVGAAGSGTEAVDQVASADPDVVVLDFKMPGLDGIDTARLIRERRPDQPLILYTAFIDDDLKARAADAGIAVCLGKVEGLNALEREIRRLARTLL